MIHAKLRVWKRVIVLALPCAFLGVLWFIGQPRPGLAADPLANQLRLSVVTSKGVFVVYDALTPSGDRRPPVTGQVPGTAGFMAYWRDEGMEQTFVYGDLVYEGLDVGHALVALERDLGVNVDALSAASQLLASGLRDARADRPVDTRWERGTHAAVTTLMGFSDREAPWPLMMLGDNNRDSLTNTDDRCLSRRDGAAVVVLPSPPAGLEAYELIGHVNQFIGCCDEPCPPEPLGCDPHYVGCCCDDGIACTTDSCTATGCSYRTNCGQGNACVRHLCTGSTSCYTIHSDCDDQNACTSDWCDPDFGCRHDHVCPDSNNHCEIRGCSPQGGCEIEMVHCEDIPCADLVGCDPETGQCVYENWDCDEPPPCKVRFCDENGACVQIDLDCNDDDPCTDDYCDGDGVCQHPPRCTSANPCQPSVCIEGTCYTEFLCNDHNPCTEDTCEVDDGSGAATCLYTPLPDCTECGNGQRCHGGECLDPGCSLSLTSTVVCRGDSDEVTLTATCWPDCDQLLVELDVPEYLAGVPESIGFECTGEPESHTFSVMPTCEADIGSTTIAARGFVGGDLACSIAGEVNVTGMLAIPQRDVSAASSTVYVLPNDVETFELQVPNPDEVPLCFTLEDTTIAAFRVGDQRLATVCPSSVPYQLDIQGLDDRETRLTAHDAQTDELICCMPVKVGGSITLEFDTLPTYTPTTELNTSSTGGHPIPDFHLVSDGQEFAIPLETLSALETTPNAIMSYRIIVRDADDHAMVNKWVAVIQVPDDAYPTANRMTISVNDPPGPQTNEKGRVWGTIQLEDGTLDVIELREWRLLILVGFLAERYHENPDSVSDPQAIALRGDVPLSDRVNTGHLIRVKREVFESLDGTLELSMSVSLPHVGKRFYGIFMDFFENFLMRGSYPIAETGPPFSSEPWRLVDVHSGDRVHISSDQWLLPIDRHVVVRNYPRPLTIALSAVPQDDVTTLMHRLVAASIQHEAIDQADPPVGQTAEAIAILAGTLVSELAIGMTPIVGDTRDIVNEIWDYVVEGEDISKISLTLSVIGLAGDFGLLTPVTAVGGVAVNGIVAIIKALEKTLPPSIFKAIVAAGGGGRAGILMVAKFVSKFTYIFQTITDWINPVKYYEVLKRLLTQLFRVVDSPVVRHGGATYDDIAEGVGKSIRIMSRRGRAMSDNAADGIASYVRHGDGGADQYEELIRRFPDQHADDACENVSEAIQKTYRNELVDAPGTPNFDRYGKKRVDEAVESGLKQRAGNLDEFIGQHVGPDRAFSSFEEFEACLRMRGQNLKPEQVQAINSMRQAIGIPAEKARLAKVLDIQRAGDIIRSGNPNLSGFFTEGRHVDDLVTGHATTAQMSDRLRLDYPGTPFVEGAPHVILETKMTKTLRENSRIPRSSGYSNGNPSEHIEDLPYPNGGNGFALSKDGYNVPETSVRPTPMSAGAEQGVPDTVMRFRFRDGSPYPQTIPGLGTSSSWKLVPDPNSATGTSWVPYLE